MPTVYQRLLPLCVNHKKELPKQSYRILLGKEIADYYVNNRAKYPFPLRRIIQPEPDGVHNVISYPKCFTAELDRLIAEFFTRHPDAWEPVELVISKKRKRMRIPAKHKIPANG